MATVKEEVATRLAARGNSVRDIILSSLVEDGLKAQVAATTSVMRQLDQAQQEIYKFKPTIPGYDLEGKALPGVWTKEQLDQKKAAEEKVKNLQEALDEAIGAGFEGDLNVLVPNFTKVMKLGKEKNDK